jgi:hypothetical protein
MKANFVPGELHFASQQVSENRCGIHILTGMFLRSAKSADESSTNRSDEQLFVYLFRYNTEKT